MVEANFSFFTFHFSLFLCIFAVRMKKLLLIITSLLMTITISADDAQNVESRRPTPSSNRYLSTWHSTKRTNAGNTITKHGCIW